MSVHWIRALHRELGREVVMPAAAVQHSPGWEAVGKPSTDADALRRALEADQAVDADLVSLATEIGAEPPSFPPPTPPVNAGAGVPKTAAPHDDDPKEQ